MAFGMWTLVLLLLNVLLGFALFNRRKRRRGEPPHVYHKLPIVGGALQFGKDPLTYLRDLRKSYGDVFTVLLAGWEFNFFANPGDVKNLEKQKILKQGPVLHDFATRVIGLPHAIDADGVHNPRGPDMMRAIATTMRGSVPLSKLTSSCVISTMYAFENAIKNSQWFEEGKSVGLYDVVGEIIYDLTFNMFFGYRDSERERQAERKRFYDDFMVYFDNSALLVDRVSINLLPKVRKARNNLYKSFSTLDLENRTGVSDLIKSVADINKKEEQQDEQMRHFLILLWSAQANSRPAVFWTLFHLIQRPEVVEKILQEYDSVMELKRQRQKSENKQEGEGQCVTGDKTILSAWLGISQMANIDRKDLDKMVLLDSCIKESLRLVGSSLAVRMVTKDTSIRTASGKKYNLRQGDYSAVFSMVTHMDETIHKTPEKYIYDRFVMKRTHEHQEEETITERKRERKLSTGSCSSVQSEEGETSQSSAYKARTWFGKSGNKISASRALLTFGYGINRCPGRHIALIEIKLCVLIFFRYFNLSFVNNNTQAPLSDMRHLGFGVMPPVSDVQVNVSRKRTT